MAEQKIKLLHLVEAMGGGVFTYIVDLTKELVDEFDVYVAYAVRSQTPKDFKEYFDPRVHLIEVEHFCREIRPKEEFKAIQEVNKIAEEVQPDIIHLHSSKAGVIGRIAFRKKDIPLFYTPHGYSFLMKNYEPIKRRLFKTIEQVCARTNCVTISCGQGEHEETLRLTKKAECVPNGIDIDNLKRDLSGIHEYTHPFTVYTLGRVCYQKNPELFNRIAIALPNVQFIWIGDGEMKNHLKAQNIQVTGWIDRKNALQISMNADAFLLTSIWEGLPISLLESMFMKKPCIVNDTIGNKDVIKAGKNGYICKKVDQFVEAIQEIQNGQAQSYIDAAYADIIENYDMKKQAYKYGLIYKKYLQK